MEKILVLGNTGTGKTYATQYLDPKKTIIVQSRKKRMGFRADKDFVLGKNRFIIDTNKKALAFLKRIESSSKIDNINIVFDDMNYNMVNEYMIYRNEKGYDKFERLAFDFIDVVNYVDEMTTNGIVVFMAHTQKDADGEIEFKSVGRFVSEKFCLEGCFETVLLCNPDHTFSTKDLGPSKSASGMFESEIKNDLAFVIDTYNEFYGITEESVAVIQDEVGEESEA